MYIVTNKEDNFVLDVSENISYDVFGNILFHNKAVGYFKDSVNLYANAVLPEDYENNQWIYDGETWTKLTQEDNDVYNIS